MKKYCAAFSGIVLFFILLESCDVRNVMGGNFDFPSGLAIEGTNLYVADYKNNTIRKIEIVTGRLTTFPGTRSSGSRDGTRATARFKNSSGLVSDGTNLYVTDYYNDTIRKIVIATGTVTTLAGMPDGRGHSNMNGTGAAARFSWPSRITTDGINLYVADYGNSEIRKIVIAVSDTGNNTIRKIAIATKAVTTIAGKVGSPGSADSP